MGIQLIGKSKNIQALRKFVHKAAQVDANCLLTGETGVGKGITAELIHQKSNRKSFRFIDFNCNNLNDHLVESELFGFIKGSFTGAIENKPGLIEEADKGTFFLDEIADTDINIQAKLLNVLENKKVRRIGSVESKKIDVRFICATNKNIKNLIKKAEFRKDLYYRIKILYFHIDPLRKRPEDIPLLANYFLKYMCMQNEKNYYFNQKAIEKLENYSFPGNIRELENILQRACIFAESEKITEKIIDLSDDIESNTKSDDLELILSTLDKFNGNKTKTAEELGISRQWLHKILNRQKLLQ
ncbi:MAG: AAA family ATPase [Candidatus Lokiarchaeota archaeon]|nr:AAA family ATPase [Candidatus Lokiarchaeota archaeon]